MLKLVAFDLDGTIADTLHDLAASVNAPLAALGLPTYPADDYRYFVGNGADNLIHTVLGENDTPERFEQVKSGFQAYYAAHTIDHTAPYEGIAALLDTLKERGLMTAVISNKPDAYVPVILDALYPDHRFDLAHGQLPQYPRKPAPDALIAAMETLHVSPDETLYVGDSNVDVVFAHAAGVRVCGVEWGFRGRDELIEAGADFIAADADELLEIIKNNRG